MQRPLEPAEIRLLRAAVAAAHRRTASVRRRGLLALAVVILPLWVLTIVTSKLFLAPTALWALLATVIGLWSARSEKTLRVAQQAALEDALAANRVEEIRVASTEMVELEEVGDLGACYAFQVEPDKLLIVQGQDFYASRQFPNTDFSIAIIRDSKGKPVEIAVHKRGEKLRPTRVVPATGQKKMRLPEHLEVLQGRLVELESLLASAR
jgi:hypothetical protein